MSEAYRSVPGANWMSSLVEELACLDGRSKATAACTQVQFAPWHGTFASARQIKMPGHVDHTSRPVDQRFLPAEQWARDANEVSPGDGPERAVEGDGERDHERMRQFLARAARKMAEHARAKVRNLFIGGFAGACVLAVGGLAILQTTLFEMPSIPHRRDGQFAMLISPDRRQSPNFLLSESVVKPEPPQPIHEASDRSSAIEPGAERISTPISIMGSDVQGADGTLPRVVLDLALALDDSASAALPIAVINAASLTQAAFVLLRGLPDGSALNHGEEVRVGTWGLMLEHLDGLMITLPMGLSSKLELQVDLVTSTGAELARATARVQIAWKSPAKGAHGNPNDADMARSHSTSPPQTAPSLTSASLVLAAVPNKGVQPPAALPKSTGTKPSKAQPVAPPKPAKGAAANSSSGGLRLAKLDGATRLGR